MRLKTELAQIERGEINIALRILDGFVRQAPPDHPVCIEWNRARQWILSALQDREDSGVCGVSVSHTPGDET